MRVLALYNLKRDAEKIAFDWFKRAAILAIQGGIFYGHNALPFSRDNERRKAGFDNFLKSARAGHPNSQYEIGCYYINGRAPAQETTKQQQFGTKKLPTKIT